MSSSANSSRAGHETARLKLARLQLSGADARTTAMRQVAETCARALAVDRAGIWVFINGTTQLECLSRFDVPSISFSEGQRLDIHDPFKTAIAERRVLAVTQASADARTKDLLGGTLCGANVGAFMAAPVIRDGGLAGVICFERDGAPSVWAQKDRDFAACGADMAALFLEQADRLDIASALRERREKELRDDKMMALARLARSVGHDLGNLLGAVRLLGSALEADPPKNVQALGAAVREAAALGGRMVDQLFAFGQQSATSAKTTDLVAIVRNMEPVLRRLMRDARFSVDISVSEAAVAAGATEIEQVVLNLCINAAEAISPGGHVRLEIREPLVDEPIRPRSIVLSVGDDGTGMDPETQAHIFEPYYSRKTSGHGIGLSTVYGIVSRCEGTILVDSAPGVGTTLRIALPIAHPRADDGA